MSGANDSTTGGPIIPLVDATPTDSQTADIMQQLVVGITGLDPTLVRPRWQKTPPTRPPPETNWCGVGITADDPNPGLPYQKLASDGNSLTQERQWVIQLLTSFYGPDAQYYCGVLVDGLYVKQNLDAIYAYGFKVKQIGAITRTAEQVNTQWYGRADVTVEFAQEVLRTYPIVSFKKPAIQISTQFGTDPVITTTLPP